MAGSSTKLDLTVTADARAAQRGLQGLSASLEEVAQDAARTETALSELDQPIRVRIQDEAIDNTRKEIERLTAEMNEATVLDVNADTRQAERRIARLTARLRTMERNRIDIDIDIDDGDLDELRDTTDEAGDSVGGLSGMLSKLARSTGPVLGSLIGVFAGIAVGVGAITKSTVGMADQFENAKIAFDQFLGGSEQATKFLNDLTQFAAKTPFEFNDLVTASKTLLAFGFRGKDVLKTMSLLGDAAALTGSDVAELTEIWGEMVAVGEVGNDTLLELTNKGIPAYKILAKEMGKTPAQISKLASEGKLLVDDVLPKLEHGLKENFGGGMAKQAETLGGKLSTINDVISNIGLSIGQAALPFVETIVDKLTPALSDLSTWATHHKGELAAAIGEGVADVLDFIAAAADGLGDLLDGALATIGHVVVGIGEAAQGLSDLPGVDDKLGDDTVAQGEKLIELGEAGNTASEGLRAAGEGLRDAAASVRGFADEVGDGLELNVKKGDLTQLQADLAQLKKAPPTIEVEAKITAARQAISTLKKEIKTEEDKQRRIDIHVRVVSQREQLHQIEAALDNLGKKRPTPQVKAEIGEWKAKRATVLAELESLKKKEAKIPVSATGVERTNAQIDHAARDRDSTIRVTYEKTNDAPGEHSGTRTVRQTSIVPQLFDSPETVAGVRGAARSGGTVVATAVAAAPRSVLRGGTLTQLAPKQVPIKVYLDGAEIADHLTLKADRMASASSVRRRA